MTLFDSGLLVRDSARPVPAARDRELQLRCVCNAGLEHTAMTQLDTLLVKTVLQPITRKHLSATKRFLGIESDFAGAHNLN